MNLENVKDCLSKDSNSGMMLNKNILTIDFLKNKYDELINGLRNNKDSFFDTDRLVESLKNDYMKYKKIIIAYDFDDTVYPSRMEYSCNNVIRLLRLCSVINDFEMVCYTVRSTPDMLKEVKSELDKIGIRYDAINENVPRIKRELGITNDSKIMYSIFLDNRAGLQGSYTALVEFLDWYLKQPITPK